MDTTPCSPPVEVRSVDRSSTHKACELNSGNKLPSGSDLQSATTPQLPRRTKNLHFATLRQLIKRDQCHLIANAYLREAVSVIADGSNYMGVTDLPDNVLDIVVRYKPSRDVIPPALGKYLDKRNKVAKALGDRVFEPRVGSNSQDITITFIDVSANEAAGIVAVDRYKGKGRTVYSLKREKAFDVLDRSKKKYLKSRKLIPDSRIDKIYKSLLNGSFSMMQLNGAQGEVTGTEDFDVERPVEEGCVGSRCVDRYDDSAAVIRRDVEPTRYGQGRPVPCGSSPREAWSLQFEVPVKTRVTQEELLENFSMEVTKLTIAICELIQVISDLNGSHGEYTDTDDVKGRKTNIVQVLKQTGKNIARRQGKSIARRATGMTEKEVNSAYRSIVGSLRGMGLKKKKARKVARLPRAMPMTTLSEVASKYLLSIRRPFDPRATGAHIPHFPSAPSYKCRGFLRSPNIFCGTASSGWVAFMPCVAKNYPTLFHTGALYAGASNGIIVAPTAANGNYVYSGSFANLPFTTAELEATTQGYTVDSRIVSYGARLVYAGTELNKGGLMYSYVDANQDTVMGANAGYAATYDQTDIHSNMSGVPGTLSIFGTRADHFEYSSLASSTNKVRYPFHASTTVVDNASGLTVSAPTAAFFISGVSGNPFYLEVVIHAEFIGPGVPQANMSESASDEAGFDIVQGVVWRAQRALAGDPEKTLDEMIGQCLRESGMRIHPRFSIN